MNLSPENILIMSISEFYLSSILDLIKRNNEKQRFKLIKEQTQGIKKIIKYLEQQHHPAYM